MIRILIADDHRIFRQGLSMLIAEEPEMELLAEAGNGDEAIRLIRELSPDLAVLDLSMPRPDGIEIIRQLVAEGNRTPCIILTMKDEPATMQQAILAGAKGYIVKETAFEEFAEAVRQVLAGRLWFNSDLFSLSPVNQENEVLTSREKEILAFVSEGLSSKLIADRLGLSRRTVENHRQNIMKKLNIHKTALLLKHADKMRLVQ